MGKTARVALHRNPNGYAEIEHGATRGADLGVNLRLNGVIVRPEDILNIYAQPGTGGNAASQAVYWRNIREVPANVSALASAIGTGLYAITGTGASVTREIEGVVGRTTVSNGNAVAGNPVVDLAVVVDSGDGSLVGVTRDSYGRITGTKPVVAGPNVTITDTGTEIEIAATGGGGGGNWWFDPPLAADFTLASGDANNVALADDADVGLCVTTAVAVAGSIVRYGYKALPGAGDWQVTVRCTAQGYPANFIGGGLVAVESATGKAYSCYLFDDGSPATQVRRGTVTGGFTAAISGTGTRPSFLRLAKVGANIVASISRDGKNFIEWETIALTTVFTTAPNRIGLGLFLNNATRTPKLSCDHWTQSW